MGGAQASCLEMTMTTVETMEERKTVFRFERKSNKMIGLKIKSPQPAAFRSLLDLLQLPPANYPPRSQAGRDNYNDIGFLQQRAQSSIGVQPARRTLSMNNAAAAAAYRLGSAFEARDEYISIALASIRFNWSQNDSSPSSARATKLVRLICH